MLSAFAKNANRSAADPIMAAGRYRFSGCRRHRKVIDRVSVKVKEGVWQVAGDIFLKTILSL